MRCRALPGGNPPAAPQERQSARRRCRPKNAVDVDPKMAGGFLISIQKAHCIASDSRELSKKVLQPFFGRIATKAAN
jgi:hypothetical protein